MTKNPRPALDSGPGNLNFDLPGDKIPAGILFPGLPALDSVPGILFSGLPAEEILPGILFPGLPALDSGLGILSAARPALDAPGVQPDGETPESGADSGSRHLIQPRPHDAATSACGDHGRRVVTGFSPRQGK